MLDGQVLIVGGYGAVGKVIATQLADIIPGRIIVAGRNYDKAHQLAQASGGKIKPLQLDLATAHETSEILDDVTLVIMCLDQRDTRFVVCCLQRGIDYIDISATYHFLAELEALNELAQANGSVVVLSVGLAPGLTNLLVSYAKAQFDQLKDVDIHILLGLGEAHGQASIQWTLKNLNSRYSVYEQGTLKQVKSFAEGKQTVFPGKLGQRMTYRFNLADQHILPHTLQLDSVSTWLTFDLVWVTSFLAWLEKAHLSYIFQYKWLLNIVTRLSRPLPFATEQFALQVDAHGHVKDTLQTYSFTVTGMGQGHATGIVTAQVATQLLVTDFLPGVFHIEQIFELEELLQFLSDNGLQFSMREGVDADFIIY